MAVAEAVFSPNTPASVRPRHHPAGVCVTLAAVPASIIQRVREGR